MRFWQVKACCFQNNVVQNYLDDPLSDVDWLKNMAVRGLALLPYMAIVKTLKIIFSESIFPILKINLDPLRDDFKPCWLVKKIWVIVVWMTISITFTQVISPMSSWHSCLNWGFLSGPLFVEPSNTAWKSWFPWLYNQSSCTTFEWKNRWAWGR